MTAKIETSAAGEIAGRRAIVTNAGLIERVRVASSAGRLRKKNVRSVRVVANVIANRRAVETTSPTPVRLAPRTTAKIDIIISIVRRPLRNRSLRSR